MAVRVAIPRLTNTKRLMTEAGIDINSVPIDGVYEDGYDKVLLSESGTVIFNGQDRVASFFVEWPSREVGAEIWESYRKEIGASK